MARSGQGAQQSATAQRGAPGAGRGAGGGSAAPRPGVGCRAAALRPPTVLPPPLPSRTNWTRLVLLPVLTGHVSSTGVRRSWAPEHVPLGTLAVGGPGVCRARGRWVARPALCIALTMLIYTKVDDRASMPPAPEALSAGHGTTGGETGGGRLLLLPRRRPVRTAPRVAHAHPSRRIEAKRVTDCALCIERCA